jgi:hypothetical protein
MESFNWLLIYMRKIVSSLIVHEYKLVSSLRNVLSLSNSVVNKCARVQL